MADWFSSLWGKKKSQPKLPVKAKGPAKDPRADLIKTALALHQTHGDALRASLTKAVSALEDRRTLRDPEKLERLLSIVQAQRAMQRLFAGDLRRYLVLAGMRQWNGKEPSAQNAPAPRPKVVRR